MFLQEWLKEIPLIDSVTYLREKMNCDDKMSLKDQIAMYGYFVGKLLKINIVPHDDMVLLSHCVSNRYDGNTFEVSVSGFSYEEIKEAKIEIIKASEYDLLNIDISWYASLVHGGGDLPNNYCFDFTPWENSLGWRVDPENIKTVGATPFSAYVLEELSFNGIDQDSQQERIGELTERVEETKRIFELPEEEWPNYFTKANDVFKELGFTDDRTKEEKERDEFNMRYDIIYNYISLAKTLKRHMCW